MKYRLFINTLPKEAIDIRYQVFTLEQGFAQEVDLDERDSESIHILVYDNNKAIATGRMFKESDDTYHIGRIAVIKNYRGLKIGSLILEVFEKKAKELGAKNVVLGSQIDKTEFYIKNGYQKYGDIFDDANYPHVMMRKYIY